MGNNKKSENNSRRWFLSLFVPADQKAEKPEMVKMLTPDGKLVEVEKSVLDAATKNKKATNQDIYKWMKNPSKENS
jgi:hypothetical protein